MTSLDKKNLVEYIYANCASTPFLVNGLNRGYFRCEDVRNAIMNFDLKSTEGDTCGCRPDYEKINEKLQKELDYWKTEHSRLREDNIRLEAIVHTIEQITSKNFLG